MSESMKSTPGPLPSSCLTCRRRKTQCDKARPACSRCLTSGRPCLGYDHIPVAESAFYLYSSESGSLIKPPRARPRSQLPTGPRETLPGAGSNISRPINTHAGEVYQMVISDVQDVQVNCRETLPGLDTAAQPSADTGVARPIWSEPPSNEYPPIATDDLVQSTFSLHNVSQELVDPDVLSRLPPNIIFDPSLSGEISEFIMSQYGPFLEGLLFKPTQTFLEMMRKRTTRRIYSSSMSRYSMYISARIFQALTNDEKRADLPYLRLCLGRLGQQLCIESTNERTFDDLTKTLSAGLELAFLYFIISCSHAGYTLLKNLTPTFLQIALSDFDLWSCQPDCTSISLARALNPSHPTIYRFVLMDALASLTFGVPPLIEYDTTLPQLPRYVDSIPLAAAAPELAPEFTIMIVKVSLWRAKNPGQCAPEDIWKPLEAEAWACQQSVPVEAGNLHSVPRMTIIEGWRHAVLIYLYMGMCGVSSDDPRVRSSTKQIMKLLQVVRREDWNTRNHFFVPCLMASICAPNEKHRAELSDAFLKVEDIRPWLFKVMEYKPVIEHLWHGAAANGRPVHWEDYIDSRRAMLHID